MRKFYLPVLKTFLLRRTLNKTNMNRFYRINGSVKNCFFNNKASVKAAFLVY